MDANDLEIAKKKELERNVEKIVEATFRKWRVQWLKMACAGFVLAAVLYLILLLITFSTH